MPRHTVTATTISLEHCNITVNNVDESFAFYSASLGLQVRDDVASGGFRWVTLGSDAQPGLGILPSVPHAGRSQADGDALQELLTKGVLPMLVFRSVPFRRRRRDLRDPAGVWRRGAPGADRPALRPARLRVPRSVGRHRSDLPGDRRLTPLWRRGSPARVPTGDREVAVCSKLVGSSQTTPTGTAESAQRYRWRHDEHRHEH